MKLSRTAVNSNWLCQRTSSTIFSIKIRFSQATSKTRYRYGVRNFGYVFSSRQSIFVRSYLFAKSSKFIVQENFEPRTRTWYCGKFLIMNPSKSFIFRFSKCCGTISLTSNFTSWRRIASNLVQSNPLLLWF